MASSALTGTHEIFVRGWSFVRGIRRDAHRNVVSDSLVAEVAMTAAEARSVREVALRRFARPEIFILHTILHVTRTTKQDQMTYMYIYTYLQII